MKYFFLVLIFLSLNTFGEDNKAEFSDSTPEVNKLFDDGSNLKLEDLGDAKNKEEKISSCTQKYVEQQKSYSRVVKKNLFDLFDKIMNNKKDPSLPYQEKILMLAKIQCNLYYKMGILK